MTTTPTRAASLPGPRNVRLRPATDVDVPLCGAIWRESLNDYMGRLNLPEVPDELGPIRRLHDHLHTTDPDRFWVAEPAPADPSGPARPARPGRPHGDDTAPIAFAAATRRDDVWFLSMLFVRPGEQGRGLGRALLERILPTDDPALATATDSAQPISNALYASLGIVPRLPLLHLVGRPERPEALAPLPSGIRPIPFDDLATGPPGGDGHAGLVAAVDELDGAIAGFRHPQDHRWLRLDGRRGYLYRGPDGEALGYGYTSEAGRMGPVAARDAALVAPIVGHLLTVLEPRGASTLWAPGDAGRTVTTLLQAGLRLEGFPVLLCWSRPFGDFTRYLPISPGLL